jgi:hypothetical protein
MNKQMSYNQEYFESLKINNEDLMQRINTIPNY